MDNQEQKPVYVILDSLNVRAAQKKLVEQAMQITNGNQTRAAKLLGYTRMGLRNVLKRLRQDDQSTSPLATN